LEEGVERITLSGIKVTRVGYGFNVKPQKVSKLRAMVEEKKVGGRK